MQYQLWLFCSKSQRLIEISITSSKLSTVVSGPYISLFVLISATKWGITTELQQYQQFTIIHKIYPQTSSLSCMFFYRDTVVLNVIYFEACFSYPILLLEFTPMISSLLCYIIFHWLTALRFMGFFFINKPLEISIFFSMGAQNCYRYS